MSAPVQWPANGVSQWPKRFADDATVWYAWKRENDTVPAKKCGHLHRSAGMAEKCRASK